MLVYICVCCVCVWSKLSCAHCIPKTTTTATATATYNIFHLELGDNNEQRNPQTKLYLLLLLLVLTSVISFARAFRSGMYLSSRNRASVVSRSPPYIFLNVSLSQCLHFVRVFAKHFVFLSIDFWVKFNLLTVILPYLYRRLRENKPRT